MADGQKKPGASWIVLLVMGVMLNVMGIALVSLGWPRFVLMAAGLGLLLAAVLQAQARRR